MEFLHFIENKNIPFITRQGLALNPDMVTIACGVPTNGQNV